ncbi:MAG: hypothetical protein R2823_10365 [Acidimicrobiia bacterium]
MFRNASLLMGLVLVVTACSGSDTADTTTTSSTSTTVAPATTTTAQSTTTIGEVGIDVEAIVPGENPDADAIVQTYAIVFDSTTTFEEKAPFLVDPEGLESTVDAYTDAGAAVGGIFLEVTAVGISDDLASVNYDLLFGGNVFQPDQQGDAVRVDGRWQVTRDYFCSIMALARVPCS